MYCSEAGLPRPSDWKASDKEFLQSLGLKGNKDLYTDSLIVGILQKDNMIEFSSMINMAET